jgi:hypothetical protein
MRASGSLRGYSSLSRGRQLPRGGIGLLNSPPLSVSSPFATGSTLSNIDVAPLNVHFPSVVAQPRMAFGPAPSPVTGPGPSSVTAPGPSSATLLPGSTQFLPRGEFSGDTIETAAARRERKAIQRDHRAAARAGKEVSPTPSLATVKARIARENDPSDSSGLSDAPNTSQLQTPSGVTGRPFLPFSQGTDYGSFALPLSPSPLSRSHSVSSYRGCGRSNSILSHRQSWDHLRSGSPLSPILPKAHCFFCEGYHSRRPMAAYLREEGVCTWYMSNSQPPWGQDEVCCPGRHHTVKYVELFNDEQALVQPTCWACCGLGIFDPAPDVPSSSASDPFANLASRGLDSSEFLSVSSINSSQPISYGMAARRRPNPGVAERQRQANIDMLNVHDPVLDLDSEDWRDNPALTDRDFQLLQDFHSKLNKDKLETCLRCDEKWFRMGLNNDMICNSCVKADSKLDEGLPFLYSADNEMDPGPAEPGLEPLTQIEEMLIARVHCFVEVRQVRRVQYKYKGHVVNFLTNTAKVYNRLPLLPQDLDIILLRPANYNRDPRMQRQFRQDFRVRKSVVRAWLLHLRHYHPAYRSNEIAHDNLEALPDDFFVDNELIVHEVEDETEINAGAIGADEYEEDPEVGAVPDLHPYRDEIEFISEQLQCQGAARMTVGRQPRRLPSMSMPTPQRTPLSELNKSHALLSWAFPGLFPRGQAEYVTPRLRNVPYAEYIRHLILYKDMRFAQHPRFRYVVFNTLMRLQINTWAGFFVNTQDVDRGPASRRI